MTASEINMQHMARSQAASQPPETASAEDARATVRGFGG